jgi:hypothetical protein
MVEDYWRAVEWEAVGQGVMTVDSRDKVLICR